jgi:hypothetical protein
LNASVANSGSLFSENIDNVVLTPEQAAAIPEPSSLTLLGIAVVELWPEVGDGVTG